MTMTLTGRRILLAVVPVLPVLFSARVGLAESREAKERTARTACLAGDYAQGVRLLSELFVATKNSSFIYNQGRCFEQNRRYEDAIARFQEYLRAGKNLSASEEADAQKHIAGCKELLASERAQTALIAPVAAAPVAPAAVVSTPILTTPLPNPQSPSSAGTGLRTAGILSASVGGAALVAGIVLNYKSNSLATDLKKVDGYTAGKESDRKSYKTFSWVGYGVGAACVAAGAILYVLGSGSQSATDASVAFLPAFAPDYAGASLKGAF